MRVYSYDIFDTCLVRTCGHPFLVFDILAQRILGDGLDTACYMDFALERREGEIRARKKYINAEQEEISFDQIYECCDFSLFTDKSLKEIQKEELSIERAILLPVNKIKEEIYQRHKLGEKVIFVSDMYLPYSFIEKILVDCGLFEAGDRLYLSCQVGKTKRTGGLFKFVLQDLKIRPKELCHFGDNYHSDITIPRQLGIMTRPITHAMNDYEKCLGAKECSTNRMDVKMLASISSSLRLNFGESPETLMAVDLVAPCLVPFVYDILKKASSKGVARLYFFARDAFILYKIAQEFQSEFPNIELKYLYVSRSSLYLPGLEKISYEAISNLFWNFSAVTAEEILERLHLEELDIKKYTQLGSHSEAVLRSMIQDEDFVKALTQKRDEQKSLLLDYLTQEELTKGNCAIVDLSGTRRCQIAINQILCEAGFEKVFAYYYIIMDKRIKGKDYDALHFDERYAINPLNGTLYPQELFEQYFCITDQNRTNSYIRKDNKVEPLFEQDVNSLEYKRKTFNANYNVCTLFARQYSLLLRNASHSMLAQMASSIYSLFYYAPKIEYIKAFEELNFSDSKSESTRLLYKGSFLKIAKNRRQYWRQANMMYNCCCPNILYRIYLYDFAAFEKNGIYVSSIDKVVGKLFGVRGKIKHLFSSLRVRSDY